MNHPIIITSNEIKEDSYINSLQAHSQKQKDHKELIFKESAMKTLCHSDIMIEPKNSQSIENAMVDLHSKRKEVTLAPIELKKLKIEANLKEMLPNVTIQPIVSVEVNEQSQQKLLLESNSGTISQQQMNVINREISITQVLQNYLISYNN
jgi:hypothetical protein